MSNSEFKRPLDGIRVIELAGLAPGPFAGMVLADFGADVVRVDKSGTGFSTDILARGKRSIALSLKTPDGLALLKKLLSAPPQGCSNPKCKCSAAKISVYASNKNKDVWTADVLIDPFRPGVLERLGLGPDVLLKLNPRLIIARLTGFRREGMYSKMAGHDINYLALSGVLSLLGRKGDKPYFPANLLADFAGGGIMAVVGILMSLLERNSSGRGQVVEIDMVTGTRYISSFPLLMSKPSINSPLWDTTRGSNYLDGGSPWYDVYETKDGGYMSVGALENHFYAVFINVSSSLIPHPAPTPLTQNDRSTWPILTSFLTAAFLTKTRDEWTNLFLNTDACCVAVLNRNEVDTNGLGFDEAGNELTKQEKDSGDGGIPKAAPTLSRTPATANTNSYNEDGYFLEAGKHTREFLLEIGTTESEIERLSSSGAVDIAGVKSKL